MKLLKNIFSGLFTTINKGLEKKYFDKLSSEEIYFILQSNNTKYIKTFKFISWPNFMERYHNLSPDIWDKIFTDWFKLSVLIAI